MSLDVSQNEGFDAFPGGMESICPQLLYERLNC